MKKWSGLIISMVMVASLLSACFGGSGSSTSGSNNSSGEGEVTEILFWNLFGGGDAEFMQAIVDKFNESQSDIFVKNVQQEFDEYYTKLITSIATGKGPDIAISHMHVLPELVNQGLVTELDNIASDVGVKWDEYNQNILDATIYDGKHYAIPNDTFGEVFYINNKFVDQAGLLNEDGSVKMEQTPEGFVKFLTTINEELPNTTPMTMGTTGGDPFRLWWSFYHQMGGKGVLTEDLENPEYEIDLEKAIEAANYVRDLFYEHELIPLNVADATSDFQSENAAAFPTGLWTTGIFEGTEGLDFSAMPLPNIYERNATFGNSHTFILPYYQDADNEKQKAAVKFMEFATDNGVMWAKAGHIPSKTHVVESEEFKELPYRSDYAEIADYIYYEDLTIYTRAVREILIRNLDTIWNGDNSVEDAFVNIENEIKELISG